jgi:hypothetical protein
LLLWMRPPKLLPSFKKISLQYPLLGLQWQPLLVWNRSMIVLARSSAGNPGALPSCCFAFSCCYCCCCYYSYSNSLRLAWILSGGSIGGMDICRAFPLGRFTNSCVSLGARLQALSLHGKPSHYRTALSTSFGRSSLLGAQLPS